MGFAVGFFSAVLATVAFFATGAAALAGPGAGGIVTVFGVVVAGAAPVLFPGAALAAGLAGAGLLADCFVAGLLGAGLGLVFPGAAGDGLACA